MENLVWSCPSCNSVKGPLCVEEFREKIKKVLSNPGTRVSTALRITQQDIRRDEVLFYGDGANVECAGDFKDGE